MFVVYESSILNLIGIVYLKVINVRFYFILKKSYFLRKFAQKEEGFRTGDPIRHRTPTPKPNTDTDSEPNELEGLGVTEQ